MKRKLYIICGLAAACAITGCSMSKGIGNKEIQNANKDDASNTAKLHVRQDYDYPEYENADSLVKAADLILGGTIYDKKCVLDNDKLLYTIYEVYTDKVYKGSLDGNSVTVRVPGGKLDDGEYIYSGDTVNLDIGDKYLLLTSTDGWCPGLVNLRQSAYKLDDEGRQNQVTAVNNTEGVVLSEVMDIVGK